MSAEIARRADALPDFDLPDMELRVCLIDPVRRRLANDGGGGAKACDVAWQALVKAMAARAPHFKLRNVFDRSLGCCMKCDVVVAFGWSTEPLDWVMWGKAHSSTPGPVMVLLEPAAMAKDVGGPLIDLAHVACEVDSMHRVARLLWPTL